METLSLPNEKLSKHLAEIAEFYKIEKDTYRYKVFIEASQKLVIYPDAITSGLDAKEKIGKGIGPSIMEVIDEYMIDGTSKRLDNLKNKNPERNKVLEIFMTVHGIGPVNANKFYDMGFRTLDELWYKADLTEAQKITIYYRDHLSQRIPRDEINWLDQYLKYLFPLLQIEIVGSYRRGETTSGDIDVLIKKSEDIKLSNIVNTLKKSNLIISDLALGDSKYMGLIRIGTRPVRRLDLLLINEESWAPALLYFTGSQRFNILMRQKAKDLGLRLNEYGLHNFEGLKLLVNSEEDIFTLLGLKYYLPTERVRNILNLN